MHTRFPLPLLFVLLLGTAPALADEPSDEPEPADTPKDDEGDAGEEAEPDPEAKPPSEDMAKAKELFEKGLALLDAEDYEGALAYFEQSRALVPSKGNTTNAAICLDRLGRYDEALDQYEVVLLEHADELDDEDRAAIAPEMKRLRGLVGKVQVTGDVDAMVVIDGRERGKLPRAAIHVLPGEHVVRVVKAGHVPTEATVEVAAQETVRVEARLQPETPDVPTPEPELPDDVGGERVLSWNRGWVFFAGGLGVDITGVVGGERGFHRPSVGFAFEALVGLTPYAQLGGFFRIGYGGLTEDALPASVRSGAESRTSLRVGPRLRLSTPAIGGAVTPFADVSFAYHYTQISVSEEECTPSTSILDEEEECTSTTLAKTSYEAAAFGFGGGIAFETSEWGEADAGPDGHQSVKVYLRGTYYLNNWLSGRDFEDIDAGHVEGSVGILFW